MSEQEQPHITIEGRRNYGLGENLAERGTILLISSILAIAMGRYRGDLLDLLPLVLFGIGVALTIFPFGGRFLYQWVFDGIRDTMVASRDGIVYEEPPEIGIDEEQHPFDPLEPDLVVFEPTYEGEDMRVLPVIDGPDDTDLIMLRLSPTTHGAEHMDPTDRHLHNGQITRFLTGCFNANVLQVAISVPQLPVDTNGQVCYLRETMLYPEEVDDIQAGLLVNLSEAHDVISNRSLDVEPYVAVVVNRKEAWGLNFKFGKYDRPTVVKAEDVEKLPLHVTLESVKQAARTIGFEADWVTPVEFKTKLRCLMTPEQATEAYREQYQDSNDPVVQRNHLRGITMQRRLRPRLRAGHDYIQTDGGFHRLLRMPHSEEMAIDPDFRDQLYRLTSKHGFITHTVVGQLSPVTGQKRGARAAADARQIANDESDLYRPEREQGLQTSQQRLKQLSLVARLSVRYEDLILLWAPTMHDLDRVTKLVRDEHALYELPYKVVEGDSLQDGALLRGLGLR